MEMTKDFMPILLASDINVYSMARAFHEEYGIKSLVLARDSREPLKSSKIAEIRVIEGLDQPEIFFESVMKIREEFPEGKLVLIGCADHYVRLVVAHKERLKGAFVVPYADQDVLDNIVLKETFYSICGKYDLDFAKTFVYRPGDSLDFTLDFDFPVVLKPSCSVSYNAHAFEGQHKVYFIDDMETLKETIKTIYEHGYDDSMIVQDKVPGEDAQIYDLHVYTGSDHKVKYMNMGNVVLEEHTPKGIGSNAATIVEPHEEVMMKVKNLLEGIGYEGWADCDLKLDPRDGIFKIFEINIRQGRSHYRNTGSGNNVAKYIVDDYVYGKPQEFKLVRDEFFWHVVPLGVVYKYVKDQEKVKKIKRLVKEGKVCHSLYYDKDKSLKRTFYLKARDFRMYKKYKTYMK